MKTNLIFSMLLLFLFIGTCGISYKYGKLVALDEVFKLCKAASADAEGSK